MDNSLKDQFKQVDNYEVMDYFQKVSEDKLKSRNCDVDFGEAKHVIIDPESTAIILFS